MAKIKAGADYAITQMLFSAADYVGLRDRMAAAGVARAGAAGHHADHLVRAADADPRAVRATDPGRTSPSELRAVQDDPAAGRQVGMDHAVRMREQLLAEGAPCLHFYTFNRSKATIEVLTALGMTPALRR